MRVERLATRKIRTGKQSQEKKPRPTRFVERDEGVGDQPMADGADEVGPVQVQAGEGHVAGASLIAFVMKRQCLRGVRERRQVTV
jgi:hypothetical protein